MDLEFRSILEQPTSQQTTVSPEVQLTVAYIRAIKSGDTRQAHRILEEKEIIERAKILQIEEEINRKKEIESFTRISAISNALLEKIGDKNSFSVDDLEDTLDLRSGLFREANTKENLVARRFIAANRYLEDSIINDADTKAPLVMLKQSLKDLQEISAKVLEEEI